MNITRRSVLKAFGLGSLMAISGGLAAKAEQDLIRTIVPGEGITVNSGAVSVYSINDLPSPVDGVVTLEENTTYNMMNPIDMGDLGLTAKNCRLNGHHDGGMFTKNYLASSISDANRLPATSYWH